MSAPLRYYRADCHEGRNRVARVVESGMGDHRRRSGTTPIRFRSTSVPLRAPIQSGAVVCAPACRSGCSNVNASICMQVSRIRRAVG
jgi:hypothetical protein